MTATIDHADHVKRMSRVLFAPKMRLTGEDLQIRRKLVNDHDVERYLLGEKASAEPTTVEWIDDAIEGLWE